MKRTEIQISVDLFRKTFHFPWDMEVVEVVAAKNKFGVEHITLVVEHPGLPESDAVQDASPTFRTNPPVEFLGWNARSKP